MTQTLTLKTVHQKYMWLLHIIITTFEQRSTEAAEGSTFRFSLGVY